eukprot:gene7389-2712_t
MSGHTFPSTHKQRHGPTYEVLEADVTESTLNSNRQGLQQVRCRYVKKSLRRRSGQPKSQPDLTPIAYDKLDQTTPENYQKKSILSVFFSPAPKSLTVSSHSDWNAAKAGWPSLPFFLFLFAATPMVQIGTGLIVNTHVIAPDDPLFYALGLHCIFMMVAVLAIMCRMQYKAIKIMKWVPNPKFDPEVEPSWILGAFWWKSGHWDCHTDPALVQKHMAVTS